MRPPGLPVAVILLVFTSLAIQVSHAGDLYWEGEEEGSDEFLEVKDEDTGLAGHLKRLKRNLLGDFFNVFSSSSTTTTEAPQALEIATDDPDADNDVPDRDEDLDHGSGLPDRGVEQDLGDWKTLRVTFVVMEPYQTEYSNRDSEQFRNFSHTIDHAVDKLYENLPGTQKASLVRIQSRISDEFSCKVTLDIVTTGYDNLDRISQTLQDHIRNRRKLDTVTVSDADFSANPVDPGLGSGYVTCRVDEIRCGDDACVPGSARCNGVSECADGSDEAGCRDFDDINQVDEDSSQPPPACERISCSSSAVVICSEQRCDGIEDCPQGDDEQGCAIAETTTLEPKDVKEDTTLAPPRITTTEAPVTARTQTDAPLNCPDGFFPCDETRCVSSESRCNNARDCFDGTDELGCDMESCAADDFRCPSNGKCLEAKRRCDRVVDCPYEEDEQNCVCREDEFRCVSDSSCIEGRKRCDGVNHCKDSSDELDCPCSSNQWQCDAGNCITRTKRCDGRIDCPSDRSDERNCVAKGKFRCRTGKSIPQYQRCNRHYDCPTGDYSDEQNCPCGDNDFQCDSGHCIPESKHCDRTHDCQDSSDERDCIYGTVCMAFQYKCTSGQCVPAESLCNGTTECGDWSDEQNCPCKRGQFYCRDGSCINIALRCNGQKDCHPAGEDEFNCAPPACPRDSFTCNPGSATACAKRCDDLIECDGGEDEDDCTDCSHECDGICLEEQRICDRNPDCKDGSDELNCDHCDGPDDFRCNNGECINSNQHCNGILECADESDEIDCNTTMTSKSEECSIDEYQCRDGTCINSSFYCDGRNDCLDNSDEDNCPWHIARPSRSPDQPACLESEFTCYDGRCITHLHRCDNIYDCMDFSDEQNCDNPGCSESQWQCESGMCIPLSAYCDGNPDCSDYTDENDCPTTPAPYYTTTPGRLPNLRPSEVSTYKPIFIDPPENSRPGIGTNNGNNPFGNDGNYLPETNEISGNLPESGYNQPGQGYPTTSGRPEYGRPDFGGDFGGSRADSGFNRPGQGYPTTTGRPEYGRPGGDSGFRPGQGGGSSGNNLDSDFNRPGLGGDTTSGRPDYDYNRPGQGGDSGSNRPDYEYNRPGQDGDFGNNRPDYGSNRPGQGGDSESNRPDYGYNRPGQGGDTTGSRPDYDYNRPGQVPVYNRPGGQQGGDNGARPLGPDRDACERNQWRCENGPCIDSKRRCDGRVDCPFDSSDEFDCPPGSPTALNLKTYPSQQTVRNGGDVVFQCRDEGPLKTPVRWLREGGRPLKSGSTDERGRLEMNHVTTADSGVYICQAFRFIGSPNSELRVTLNVDPSPVTAAPPQFACQPYEATCGNGQCIPKSAVCNNVVDCADRSDEEACHTNGKCEPNQFKCNNNKCVLKTWLCDSEDDCGDGSDEQDCGYSAPGQCKTVEYTCTSRDQCVPKSFHCDGQSDCLDGSDEIGCAPVYVTKPPQPANVILNTGDTLTLNCSATGTPTPLISWRRNWGDVPEVCTSENIKSNGQVIGVLVCPNMQSEYNGAYSCEAMNNKGTIFAVPDAIVFVNKTSVCPNGYFNSEARSERECIRCFCFGESTSCRSADLFTYNMPTPLGQGGTRLVGVKNTVTGDVEIDMSTITDQYYYQPLRNGATVTKLARFGSNRGSSNTLPYLTLPETYNGNQLTSYGGHIKYKVSPHLPSYGSDYGLPDVIVKGKYQSLVHFSRGGSSAVEARLTPGNWEKPSSRGLVSATREDIMMALDNVEMILLRSSINNAGVNITNFVMESAHNINTGLGAASLVEECTCPPGYEGLSCQKCASGFAREQSGPWLGNCVRERPTCPPGTYGDPSSGYACRPCPCPLTNKENQFARTCAIGPNGNVICDCATGYEGPNCEYCAQDHTGNPLVVGDSCKPKPSDQCNPVGTSHVRLPDECQCKDNVQGRQCDQCKNDSFYLSKDFRQGCALCFCSGVTQQCMSSNLRRKSTTVRFNTPDLVSRVKVYSSTPLSAAAAVRYNAPVETNLTASYAKEELVLTEFDRNRPAIYYWSLPINFAGDKVTSYGGYLRYTLHNVPVSSGYNSKNNAADVQLISENRLTFHYFLNFEPAVDGTLEASVQFLEKGWQRPDGKEVSREHLLLALADVKAILVKATYTTNSQLASLVGASIDTAEETGDGPEALHVEQCVCPRGYVGTSCEDCAPGYTRYESGLYLEHCGPCECNGHSNMCHAETGVCTNCQDNTAGDNCEICKPGYRLSSENNCVLEYTAPLCDCDERGSVGLCDERGYCACKQNVEGQNCDTCRAGTFGLDASNPLGCYSCYCSGVTSNCHEASSQYIRVPMAAPVFGDDYGGYTLMDVNAQRVLNDHIVSMPTESELMYVFAFPPDEELYWSLPVFPGNRILSYGGTLQLKQRFESRDSYAVSEPGTDVILVGDDKSLYWTNSLPIRAGEPLTFKVPLTEQGWYLLNYATPASRNDLLAVLKSLRRVLVRATLTRNIESSSIADVSMDTATDMYEPSFPTATGVEICMCPEGYSGTSCESCISGFYKDQFGCQQCNCNGHDCYLTSNDQVVCSCRPPYTGNDCSILGDSSKKDNGTTRPPPPRTTVVVQITSPTIKIQNIGSTVNFTCQAMSQMTRGNLPVTWSKDDGYLPQGRSLVDERLGTLTITNLQISDSGKYICQTSDGISSAQAIATLKVPGNDMTYPSLEIRPPFNDYFEGERIQLECVASGNPAPTVTWQRSSGRPLPAYAEIIDELFIIENAREEDSGEYRCIVSNALGSSDRTAVVNVRQLPSQPARDKLTVSHKSPTVDEGQTTKLVCTGTANVPAGTIDWIRQDGTQLQSNVRSDNGVLYINTARLDNQGVYVCQTSSYDVSPVLVVVTVIPKGTQAPELQPNITVSRDSLKIPTGGNGLVECNPRGYPLPLITWRKYEGGFGPNTRQRDNTLIIANASDNDQGYYLCEGTVDGQPVANIYVYVEIEKREQPQIEIWPQGEQAVTIGSPFDLRCRITAGIPEPDVLWSRASGRQLSETAQLLPNHILRFESVDVNDEGEYSCTASNLAGSSTASATIRVRSPPEVTITPSDYIEAVYGDSVTVHCRARGYPEPMVSIKTNPDMREIVAPARGMAVLRISSATERDDGDYICSATSLAGTIEEQFGIRVERGDGGFGGVEGSGEIDIDPYPSGGNNEQPSDLIAIEGQETRIGCDASSDLDVQWSRADRRPLQTSAQQSGSNLIIRGTSKQDAGRYVCNLYDRYTGEVIKSATTSLVVMAAPRIILQPPTQTVHPGESPTVECVVDGDEIQEIFWRPLTRPFSSRVEVRRSTLIFNRIEVEDAGRYECFAKNRVANTSATAEVVVSEETDRAPSESHDNEQQAHVGAAVHLSCNVHTSAGYRISWTKDGMRLPRNVNQRHDGSLYIRFAQKSDSGRYVCDIQDKYGRRTSNYINLHIDGDEDCTDTQFRCYDSTGCVDVGLLCDGERDCPDNSDEDNCILREKKIRNRNAEYRSDAGPPSEVPAIVSIDQPRRQFRVGENVELLCRARSRGDRVSWERYGTRQYVESRTFGGGAMLVLPNVQESDAGIYRCTGTDPYGRVSFEDFNLEVQPGTAVAYPDYRPEEVAQYTVRQGDSINMPCSHNLEQPVHVEWRREFTPLQPEVRPTEPTLHLERIVEADAGTYVCRVSNSRTAVETRAVLRVAGVVPRFDGGSWISLPTIENAYRQFDIEISFKPIDNNGLILYNSEQAEPAGDYLALQLVRGVPQFIMDVGDGPIVVDGDRPLQLNTWHTIRISKTNSKVIMDVDNNGPASVSSTGWDLLELKTPLYIGGVPDYNQLPAPLAETSGFIGCVSMLILGNQEKNVMLDKIEQSNVLECDSCNPNLCNKNGVCQEARNERGYVCLCGQGFAGLNCDRTGEACRQGLCGPGKCTDTADGYKCACPVTYTGKNCDVKQSIEYPAFTGSAYLAIKAPRISRLFRMSMKVKAASPLTDGIIMYSAESPRGYGGFTALNVHNGRLEFIYDVGDGSRPVVLTSNRTLPPNEWTDVHILRVGPKVTLTINLQYNFEDKLESSKNELNLETPMFVGGADDSIVLNKNIGVTGGFRGCIKDVMVYGLEVDIVGSSIQSANVQECSNYKDDRGDIPEVESVCSQCRNGGECTEDGAGCVCPAGFSGQFCENYVPSPARRARGDPCLLQPCRNGGSCRRDYSTRMNYTCDCRLGFAGTNCQMPLELRLSVAFNGNGYVELPASKLRYDGLRAGESVILAVAFYSNSDGVLLYQRELRSAPYAGDYIIIRIDNGFVVMEWDLGGGVSSVSVDDVYVLDLVRHSVIAKIHQDGSVSLTVDTWTTNGTSTGFSNLMNADSNIYVGGIPESMNVRRYPGLRGCVEQVELMGSARGINLGQEAVAGRNTQRCRKL